MESQGTKEDYKILLNQLIQVAPNDQYLGPVDKWKAHTNSYLREEGALPHRAFSIFLFNSKNQLLLQKRSADKKTFPLTWTNTCCSHPNIIELNNSELAEEPIRHALHRALMRELTLDLTHQSFYFMRKIFYKQEAKEVEGFGEYEVDYVFVCKLATDTLDFTPVPEEIDQACWISQEKLPIFMKEEIEKGGAFSPWFSKMECNGLLHEWWQLASRNDLKDAPGENEKLVLSLS